VQVARVAQVGTGPRRHKPAKYRHVFQRAVCVCGLYVNNDLPVTLRAGSRYNNSMAYVVAEPCIKCKYTDCVEVCPVSCFKEGANFLVIEPNECIDCGACEPVCPTKAIFPEGDLPEKWAEYKQLNADLSAVWPTIDTKKDALPEAEEYKAKEAKRGLLDPSAP
jgi:ferredoxin